MWRRRSTAHVVNADFQIRPGRLDLRVKDLLVENKPLPPVVRMDSARSSTTEWWAFIALMSLAVACTVVAAMLV